MIDSEIELYFQLEIQLEILLVLVEEFLINKMVQNILIHQRLNYFIKVMNFMDCMKARNTLTKKIEF